MWVPQIAPLHNAEDMQAISNLAHQVEGVVVATAAILALVQSIRFDPPSRIGRSWPALITVAGVFLLGYLLVPHHGVAHARSQWQFILEDEQQRQHLMFGVLITVGGIAELLYRADGGVTLQRGLVWPAAVLVIGAVFAAHRQHGTEDAVVRALLLHRVLGVILIVTAVIRAAELLWETRARELGRVWPMTMLAAAFILMSYREPPGAYHPGPANAHGDPGGHVRRR